MHSSALIIDKIRRFSTIYISFLIFDDRSLIIVGMPKGGNTACDVTEITVDTDNFFHSQMASKSPSILIACIGCSHQATIRDTKDGRTSCVRWL